MKELFKKFDYKLNEPMKNHTTFKIGGPCDILLLPKTDEEVKDILKIILENNLKYRIIGNGSNLLISDKGLRECVIKLDDNFSKMKVEENYITAEAGVYMEDLANFACKNSLSGLEEVSGIPGDIGGLITMNAGAYGVEMKNIVKEVEVLNENLDIYWIPVEEMNLSYRHSRVQEERLIVLRAKFELIQKNKDEIEALQEEYTKKRMDKQPLDKASAGSAFKRPEGHYAAKLIDDAGLRGFSVGDARVSTKHCGFIVNTGNATAKDVEALVCKIQKIVWEKFQVELEPEIRIIGE